MIPTNSSRSGSLTKAVIVSSVKKAMAAILVQPRLLALATTLISRFPSLFEGLIGFAQTQGLIASSEEDELEEIQLTSELAPAERIIFEKLKSAHNRQAAG